MLGNKSLSEDLRQKIIESLYEQEQQIQQNLDYELSTRQEINCICIKLCQSDFNQAIFDSLIDFTIHTEKNFVISN